MEIKPIEFSLENCERIADALADCIKREMATDVLCALKTECANSRQEDGSYLIVLFDDHSGVCVGGTVGGDIPVNTYSYYMACFHKFTRRWLRPDVVGVSPDAYKLIKAKATAILRFWNKSASEGDAFPVIEGVSQPLLQTLHMKRLAEEPCRPAERGDTLPSEISEARKQLDRAIAKAIEQKDKKIKSLEDSNRRLLDTVRTHAGDIGNVKAETKRAARLAAMLTLIKAAHAYVKQCCSNPEARLIRDFLQNVLTKHFPDCASPELHELITEIETADNDKWEQMIAALEKPKVTANNCQIIEHNHGQVNHL